MPSLEEKSGSFNARVNGKKNLAMKRKIGASTDGNTAEATWDSVPFEFINLLVLNVTRCGGAITFGRTRDKGALTVTPLHDDFERQTHYVRPNSPEGWALLVDIYDTFAELAGARKWEG